MTQTLSVGPAAGTRASANRKTGPLDLVTYRTQDACPDDCVFFENGCYALDGPMGMSPFKHAARGSHELHILRAAIANLKPGNSVRFNVSGDYLLDDGTPDHEYIEATNTVPEGVTVISYTHACRRLSPFMFRRHTRPNASCDTEEDVAEALAAGWAAVIVNHDEDTIAGGHRAVICPYQTHKVQCIRCRLCANTDRKSVVVFELHGVRQKKALVALAERRSA